MLIWNVLEHNFDSPSSSVWAHILRNEFSVLEEYQCWLERTVDCWGVMWNCKKLDYDYFEFWRVCIFYCFWLTSSWEMTGIRMRLKSRLIMSWRTMTRTFINFEWSISLSTIWTKMWAMILFNLLVFVRWFGINLTARRLR